MISSKGAHGQPQASLEISHEVFGDFSDVALGVRPAHIRMPGALHDDFLEPQVSTNLVLRQVVPVVMASDQGNIALGRFVFQGGQWEREPLFATGGEVQGTEVGLGQGEFEVQVAGGHRIEQHG
jgi:hypothetical protein